MVCLAVPRNDNYPAMFHRMKKHGSGKCNFCDEEITDKEPFVTRKAGKTKYYHRSCAKRLNII